MSVVFFDDNLNYLQFKAQESIFHLLDNDFKMMGTHLGTVVLWELCGVVV